MYTFATTDLSTFYDSSVDTFPMVVVGTQKNTTPTFEEIWSQTISTIEWSIIAINWDEKLRQ